MKESYVTYEQAVKLKELGFAIEWANGVQYIKKLPDTEREVYDEDECQWHTEWDIERYPKPRLDQAQKWLREVKGIAINVIAHDGGLYHWENIYLPIAEDFDNYVYPDLTQYDSYEQALNVGIDAALKILEKQV